MRIVLARHGETSWNVEGRSQGQTYDIPLSEAGRAQAGALAGRLAGLEFARAVASPLLRARQTAEIALGGQSGKLILDPRLMEISHGEWEGRLAAEVRAGWPDLQRAWQATPGQVRLPGGETLQEVATRGWAAFQDACAGAGPGELVLIVTHDAVNRAILCRILGLELDRVWSFRQAASCLNLLEGQDPDHLQIVRLNDASHAHPLFGEPVHRRL